MYPLAPEELAQAQSQRIARLAPKHTQHIAELWQFVTQQKLINSPRNKIRPKKRMSKCAGKEEIGSLSHMLCLASSFSRRAGWVPGPVPQPLLGKAWHMWFAGLSPQVASASGMSADTA